MQIHTPYLSSVLRIFFSLFYALNFQARWLCCHSRGLVALRTVTQEAAMVWASALSVHADFDLLFPRKVDNLLRTYAA